MRDDPTTADAATTPDDMATTPGETSATLGAASASLPEGPAYVEDVSTAFTSAMDLAARRLGGMVLDASDEFFAAKENLLEPSAPVFDPDAYGDRGKIMDGWESRRRRTDGVDTATIRLGVPGTISAVVVDTTHFRGNAPAACWLEGCVTETGSPDATTRWFPLLSTTPLQPDTPQQLHVAANDRVTHVRLGIVPDGGVARLRVLGHPLVDLHLAADPHGRLDLAAAINGGRAVGCSDEFFSSPHNLIMVGDSRDMSDGWETRRRRGPGEDWAILELAATGVIDRIELDTTHFKGNYPDRCIVEGIHAPGADIGTPGGESDEVGWIELVPETPMQPHARHAYDVTAPEAVSHLRLRVVPDGGVARLRAYGTVDDGGWIRHGMAHLDLADADRARADLLRCCGSTAWAEQMTRRRPFGSRGELLRQADEVWASLSTDDHLEAFAAHPRIGERSAARWSSQEQAGVDDSEQATRDALLEGNRVYEERFDHVFLICATGKSADEMLAALRQRLDNDPVTELTVAAEEQRQITHLRLDKLLRDGRTG
jgi:allantoicase